MTDELMVHDLCYVDCVCPDWCGLGGVVEAKKHNVDRYHYVVRPVENDDVERGDDKLWTKLPEDDLKLVIKRFTLLLEESYHVV